MLSDLVSTEKYLDAARVPEDVFGAIGGDRTEQRRALGVAYRRTVGALHPDKYTGTPHQVLAQALFVRLTEWRQKAEQKIEAGTYGDRREPPPPPAPVPEPRIIRTPRRSYVVGATIATGDIADVYECTYVEKDVDHPVVLKVASSAADNDLLENEAATLRVLYPEKQVEEKFYRYLAKPIDSFMLRGDSGSRRRVNVMQLAEGHVSMADVRAAYPTGLDYRDAIWMFKRLLAGLGLVHSMLVVHGAILPPHVMVHPTGHGAKIVDWCYSVRDFEKGVGRVRAISKPYRAFYAPEILEKKPPTPQTDIYMAAKCVVALLGGDVATNRVPDAVPMPIQAFLGGCLLRAQFRRPDSAWSLHEEFDDLLLRVVGKPRYRPLRMPGA